MQRITEEELMDDPAQALAYTRADFSATHGARVGMFRSVLKHLNLDGAVLDLGCGSGDVLLRFARAYPQARFLGVDGARSMLQLAQRAIDADATLRDRVQLQYGILPDCALPAERWQLIMSHSLLHQLHEPQVLWRTIAACGDAGSGRGGDGTGGAVSAGTAHGGRCAVFVADLRRPDSEQAARELVRASSGDEPEILQRDFYNSLCAAFEPYEVRAQLAAAGLGQLEVNTHAPFHLSVSGVL
jgi:SAM-dependent methyltransferase